MKMHVLVISVKAPKSLSVKKVSHLIDRLIAIGLDDADESYKLGDAKDSECSQALKLEIGKCTVNRTQ